MSVRKNKILFIVFHPVEPHIYNSVASKFDNNSTDIRYAIFDSEGIVEKIIKSYNMRYYKMGRKIDNRILRLLYVPIVLLKLLYIILVFRPKIIFSASSPYIGLVSLITRTQSIGWSDTETATFNNNLATKFFKTILLPDTFYSPINSNNIIRFSGYKELTYLHSDSFKQDPNILKELNLNQSDKIVLMRFSALKAMHDIGLKSEAVNYDDDILEFIKDIELKYKAKVFISITERDLDDRFNNYKLNIAPEKYINLLSFCSLYIGEGTTTAAEAGVLGIPWIALRNESLGYILDQEKNYSLGFRTNDINAAFSRAHQYLSNNNLKQEWQQKRKKLLNDKIDVASFLHWFIKEYPESDKIMKENPNYQLNFKN